MLIYLKSKIRYSKMFDTPEEMYQALVDRDPKAETHFVYGVLTTKIVCRPTCSARVALFKNVKFFKNVKDAQIDGYRLCKRCKPEIKNDWSKQRSLVLKMISYISDKILRDPNCTSKDIKLDDMAKEFSISKWHMLRTFKRYTGKTPLQYFIDFKKNRYIADVPLIETKRNLIRKSIQKKLDALQKLQNDVEPKKQFSIKDNEINDTAEREIEVIQHQDVDINDNIFSIDDWNVDSLIMNLNHNRSPTYSTDGSSSLTPGTNSNFSTPANETFHLNLELKDQLNDEISVDVPNFGDDYLSPVVFNQS
ncbi:DNA binding protein [[Candida] boidinii]|nr:DNA binding protein [[Candida] boidinii]